MIIIPIEKPSRKARDTTGDGSGAQISIDYVAGVGIFLLSVAFVFQFMYNLFIPFQSGSDEVTLAADRASTILVERMLAADKSGASNVIDQGKLFYFNNTRFNYSNQTLNSYNQRDYNSLLREIGLYSDEMAFDINMSVLRLNGSIMNQSGPPLPPRIAIGQTKRLILIVNSSTGYNETAIISVRVW